MKKFVVLLLAVGVFYSQPVEAQTCAQQPPIALKGIVEWACKGMDYDQAWSALTTAGIAPVRPAKVMELGTKTNYRSRKQGLIRFLRITGFATGIVAAYFGTDNLKPWQVGALAAGPQVTAQGIEFFSGAPDEFAQTPSDAGFVTIYSGPASQQIVGVVARLRPEPTDPGQMKRNAVDMINRWGEPIFRITAPRVPAELEGIVTDMRNPRSEVEMRWIVEYWRWRMNEAEADAALARGYQVGQEYLAVAR